MIRPLIGSGFLSLVIGFNKQVNNNYHQDDGIEQCSQDFNPFVTKCFFGGTGFFADQVGQVSNK